MTRDPRNLMWAEACALLDRAEQLHRQFFEPSREGGRHARWEPPIDVFETEPLPPEYPDDKAFFTVTFFYNESPEGRTPQQ